MKCFRVRYVGVIWLLFLLQHLYLNDVWLDKDQRINNIKTHVLKRLDIFKIYQLRHTQ